MWWLVLMLAGCGASEETAPPPAPPVEEVAPPTLAERIARTREVARRAHAQGTASKIYGAYLARGADSYPSLFRSVARLFGDEMQGAALVSDEGITLSMGGRGWRLLFEGEPSYADPAFTSLVNRALADVGSDRRLAETIGDREDRYYLALHRLRLEGYLDEGLLLTPGPEISVVDQDGDVAVLSARPRPDGSFPAAVADHLGWTEEQTADHLAALGQAIRAEASTGRVSLTGFGTFTSVDSAVRFKATAGLHDAVDSGRRRAEPYEVRQAELGGLSGEQVGAVLAELTTTLAAGTGAAELPGLCEWYRTELPRRLGKDARTGEPVVIEARRRVFAECE